ncbi:MAG: tellurium resistance protein, partial [Candidatus Methylacidiphilales bacterium]
MSRRPGGHIASRPLHFIWIADCSGSMGVDGKIQALNNAIREAVPHMQAVARDNPNANVLVRAVRFSDGASWHVANPTPVQDFRWSDLTAGGLTDLGQALTLVAEEMKVPPMNDRALPPVLCLVSDGLPTDDFAQGLNYLMKQDWGRKAVRIAIAIGEDAMMDDAVNVFTRFIAAPGIKPLHANNPEALVGYIRWVSTAVLKSASSPASQLDVEGGSVMTPSGAAVPPPPFVGNANADVTITDVW